MRFLYASFLACLALVAASTNTRAEFNNECTTVVLHAVSGIHTSSCTTNLDCTGIQPGIRIDNPSGPYTAYMFLKNYAAVSGVQVAFEWPPSWHFGFGLWQCQPGQFAATTPTASGPTRGTITTAFDQILGGALAPIGWMVFVQFGANGCLAIIESSFPFGNHVIANNTEITPLRDINEGRICAGADGWNTCDCRNATPVDGATWGQIKASYTE